MTAPSTLSTLLYVVGDQVQRTDFNAQGADPGAGRREAVCTQAEVLSRRTNVCRTSRCLQQPLLPGAAIPSPPDQLQNGAKL